MKLFFGLLSLVLVVHATYAEEFPIPPRSQVQKGTQNEVQKTTAAHLWYLGFGPAYFGSLNSGDMGFGIEGARVWDLNFAVLRLAADFSIKGGAYFTSVGIGGNFFFTQESISPYLGADFGMGFTKAAEDGGNQSSTNGGFVLGGTFGVRFFRDSSVNLDIGFRSGFLLRDTTYGHPQVYAIKVGLNF